VTVVLAPKAQSSSLEVLNIGFPGVMMLPVSAGTDAGKRAWKLRATARTEAASDVVEFSHQLERSGPTKDTHFRLERAQSEQLRTTFKPVLTIP
jgi:hypothetical protein